MRWSHRRLSPAHIVSHRVTVPLYHGLTVPICHCTTAPLCHFATCICATSLYHLCLEHVSAMNFGVAQSLLLVER